MTIDVKANLPPPAVAPAGGERTSIRSVARFRYRISGEHSKVECSSAKLVIYLGNCGEEWRHHGKVGRVLEMLATNPGGITQYSTYPWHTRLATSIKTLRDSGLSIQTEREGSYRHARYNLLTEGRLVSQSSGWESEQ